VADLLGDIIETDHWGLNVEIVAGALIRCRARGEGRLTPDGSISDLTPRPR
jgi:hypothetical protein